MTNSSFFGGFSGFGNFMSQLFGGGMGGGTGGGFSPMMPGQVDPFNREGGPGYGNPLMQQPPGNIMQRDLTGGADQQGNRRCDKEACS